MDPCSVTLCVDDAPIPSITTYSREDGTMPSTFVHIDNLTLWASDPAALRTIAKALNDGADQLDALLTKEPSCATIVGP